MSKADEVSLETLKQYAAESLSKAELMRKLGYKAKGGNA